MITDPARLLSELSGAQRVSFDLDGTLYDTRDFERPALSSVVNWLRERSGQPLEGLSEALWRRRESQRHRPGLFDDLLLEYGLPATWGVECARRWHDYPGAELDSAQSLDSQLSRLRASGCRLALVTNGRREMQERKLVRLKLRDLFDVLVFCDPRRPHQLKPATWAWSALESWRSEQWAIHVGDDPVDAEFAAAGGARFLPFTFRSSQYVD